METFSIIESLVRARGAYFNWHACATKLQNNKRPLMQRSLEEESMKAAIDAVLCLSDVLALSTHASFGDMLSQEEFSCVKGSVFAVFQYEGQEELEKRLPKNVSKQLECFINSEE